jgi:hypothetical protein
MSDGSTIFFVEVTTRAKLPALLDVGTVYCVMDESRMIVNHGNVTVEYAGTANAVVDSLAGGEKLKAPSVDSVAKALDKKADLLNGKILVSQLPATMTLYRGVFATGAALAAAFPTDVKGAYATVTGTSSMWYWNGTAWADTGSLGASAVQSVNNIVGPNVVLTADDVGGYSKAETDDALAEKEDAANKGTADGYAPLDANAKTPAANLPAATESAAGILQLATAAEAKTGTNTTKAMTPVTTRAAIDHTPEGDPATIFIDPTTDSSMGDKIVTFSTVSPATGKAPLYELYGTTSDHTYVVRTRGTPGRTIQTAKLVTSDINPRVFERRNRWGNWSPWVEVPTLSYSPDVMTIIVDGENGDDAEGIGTEAKPVATIQRAFAMIPKITTGWRTYIKIKAGTYEIPSRILDTGLRLGGDLWIDSYSSARDVEIVFADSGGPNAWGLSSARSTHINIKNLRITRPSSKANNGITMDVNTFSISNCELENFIFGIAVTSANGLITGCNYINCNNALWVTNGVVRHGNPTATGTGYINAVEGGIIVKLGTHPAGTTATDRVIAGQII